MVHSAAVLTVALLLGSGAQESDADKVRALFDRLVKAFAEKDGDAINRCFHARRMVKELDSQGFGTPAADPEAEERKVKMLQLTFPKIAANSGAIGASWDKIRLLHLQVGADGSEATASCRMTVGGGTKSRMKFWLAKDDGWWKVYDFEMQEGNLRLTVMLGSLWANMGGGKGGKVVLGAFLAMQKALMQLQSGETEEARETLRKALATKPPAMLLGWLEMMDAQVSIVMEEFEEALGAAGRALEHQKDFHLVHLLKAQAFFGLKDFEKCIEAAQDYLKKSGEDADGWEMIGNAYDKLSNRKEAIAAYRKGAATDDEEHANRVSLGRLLIADGKPGEAATALKEAARNAPADGGVFEEAAEMLDHAGEFAAVVEMARDQAKRAPDDVGVVTWEGKALRKLKRFDEAEKVLRAGLEKEKDDEGLAEELIFTLAQAGKDGEALKGADKIAAENPERARFLRAFVHVAAGRPGKAVEELRAMLDEDPAAVTSIESEPAFEKLRQEVDLQLLITRAKAALAYADAATERIEKEEWEELLKLAKERVAVAPDHALAHYHEGRALRRLGRPFDAELALKAAIGKTKEKTLYQGELARAYAEQGKVDEALAVAKEVLEHDKTDGLHLKLVIYAMTKKSEPALQALEALLKEDPDNHVLVENDADLAEFRKLQAVREMLKKAKSDE